jgi:hypothetical protein
MACGSGSHIVCNTCNGMSFDRDRKTAGRCGESCTVREITNSLVEGDQYTEAVMQEVTFRQSSIADGRRANPMWRGGVHARCGKKKTPGPIEPRRCACNAINSSCNSNLKAQSPPNLPVLQKPAPFFWRWREPKASFRAQPKVIGPTAGGVGVRQRRRCGSATGRSTAGAGCRPGRPPRGACLRRG